MQSRIHRRVGECKDSKDKGRERGGEREGGRGMRRLKMHERERSSCWITSHQR